MSNAWKSFEREVAKALGGTRRIRISYSESCEDVAHPTLAIECKYGKQVPASITSINHPTDRGGLVYLPSKYINYLNRCVGIDSFYYEEGVSLKFLRDGLTQAAGYADKTPILCLKRPRMRGFVAVMFKSDYQSYLKKQLTRPAWLRVP